jgi:glutathione peroxidase-family protein
MVSLSEYKNVKGYIIIFTCNTCPYAVKYDERINDLNIKYEPLGFPVIAIMPNDPIIQPGDSFEQMKIAAKNKGYTFPYLIDEEQKIYPQFGATKTPHTFLLHKTNKGNEVVYIGAIDDNYKDSNLVKIKYVENAINSLIREEQIKVKETRAIGCTIKF